MKKAMKIALLILAMATLMYAEYRYIMTRQTPYIGEDNTVYIEMFNNVDVYDAENWED